MRNLKSRIAKLEGASAMRSRPFILWDDGTGRAQREAEELRAKHGDNILIHFVSWLPPMDDPAPIANEGSLDATRH